MRVAECVGVEGSLVTAWADCFKVPARTRTFDHEAFDAVHAHGITTQTLWVERPLSAVSVSIFLETIIEHLGADLLRVKGVVELSEVPGQPALVQCVQQVIYPIELLEDWPNDDRRCRLVFISRTSSLEWLLPLLELVEREVGEIQQSMQTLGAG